MKFIQFITVKIPTTVSRINDFHSRTGFDDLRLKIPLINLILAI